ncbi:DsbA family protein [Metabacillus malikii]|uniref:DsbA family dithiol-disulfide isomerase n=1 Tax=Metabacillus malikii TaxID=1504265 RepID=A0ABT9Z9X1_9BACI|nr:DsbA family protein [Metabacillus malikii]MDQ0229044.1 putative DsbA family dithiol-disulfide isomerase [Metabacillus malikii]
MTSNNLVCDVETGVCGVANDDAVQTIDFNEPVKKIEMYYVTDPICSHCWALEPILRRFMKQYGQYVQFKTVMGGLLEKWHGGPVDPANGIHGPSDVAKHWREVGEHYRMPIDGSLMIDNPVQSSYPPSRVFKVIQKHYGEEKAFTFLRRARVELFAFNKNIGEVHELEAIVNGVGLNGKAIVKEANEQTGIDLLNEDFALTKKLGARGFPTIILVNEEKKGVKIVGSRRFEDYVSALTQVHGEQPIPSQQQPLSALLEEEALLFSKEIEVMYQLEKSDVKAFVEKELSSAQYEVKELLGESFYTIAVK